MSTQGHILVVDDEEAIRLSIAEALAQAGYQVTAAGSGREALQHLRTHSVDLMLVDLKLPGENGLEVLAQVKRGSPGTIVIILTAYATLDSTIAALRIGADDYLLKPLNLPKILQSVTAGLAARQQIARREALLWQIEENLRQLKGESSPPSSRTDGAPSMRFLRAAVLTVDVDKRVAVLRGKPLDLTATEFDILVYLMHNAERVVGAIELLKAVHSDELYEADARSIVRVHIARLRRKLAGDPAVPYIANVRGKGYRFVAPLNR